MNRNQPFSVSMCVYGGDDPAHFDAAIASIIDQTVPPNEIVLAVDGPIPKEIQAVIDRYAAASDGVALRTVYLPRNMGHGEARRASINACTNDLIALMDADDLSVKTRFERQMDFFSANPDLSAVGGNISEFIDTPENCAGRRIVPQTDAEIKAYMKKRCPMNQVSVMFRKKDIEAVGGYIDWYCEEDYYLWIRLCLAGYKFGNVPENLVNARVGNEMYRRRGGIKYFRSEARLQAYMLKKGLIHLPRFLINVSERLIMQVLLPNRVRGFLFQKLARK